MINLFATALSLTPRSRVDTYALLASTAYIVLFGFIGIRWFRWTPE